MAVVHVVAEDGGGKLIHGQGKIYEIHNTLSSPRKDFLARLAHQRMLRPGNRIASSAANEGRDFGCNSAGAENVR